MRIKRRKINMGILTDRDARLFRIFFKEMAKLRGIKVYYRYVEKTETSIHAEFNSRLSDPIEMDIIFNENPSVNTLSKLGWVSENPDDKPYIAQLPFDAPHLNTECVIEIPPFLEIASRYRKFKITSINTLLEYPDSWTCILAPIFDNKPVKDNYEESNYNYLETRDQPISDSPDNKKESYYSYLNVSDENEN